MGKEAKIAIISSVPEGIFSNCSEGPQFSESESKAALKDELEVFVQHMKLEYLQESISFELVRALDIDSLKKVEDADAYMMGGSPSMVTEDKEWIRNLERFVHKQVDSGKPVLGMCFGHQVLVKAFGGRVANMQERHIGVDNIMINSDGQADKLFSMLDKNLTTMWSHKQAVINPGEGEVLGGDNYSDNQIVKIGDEAWGVQFHPEFTPEFMAFLLKLMKGDLDKEGIDVAEQLKKLEELKGNNPSSDLIQLFIAQYFSK